MKVKELMEILEGSPDWEILIDDNETLREIKTAKSKKGFITIVTKSDVEEDFDNHFSAEEEIINDTITD